MIQRFIAILINRIRLVFRDKTSLFFAFIFPLMLVTIFGLLIVGTRSISDIAVTVYSAQSAERSQALIDTMKNSVFKLTESTDYDKSLDDLKNNKIRFFVVLKEQTLSEPVDIQVYYNISSLNDYNQLIKPILDSITRQINYAGLDIPLKYVINEGKSVGAKINQEAVTMNGFILQSLVLYTVIGAASTISDEKQKNLLKRLGITKIKKIEFIIAYLLSFLLIGVAQTSILIIFAKFVFNVNFYNIPLLLLVTVLVNALFSFIGIFVGSVAKNANAANGLANVISFPLVILSGAWFSITFLPQWVQDISKYSPITAARIMFDQVSATATPEISAMNIIILSIFMIIFLVLSLYTLRFKRL